MPKPPVARNNAMGRPKRIKSSKVDVLPDEEPSSKFHLQHQPQPDSFKAQESHDDTDFSHEEKDVKHLSEMMKLNNLEEGAIEPDEMTPFKKILPKFKPNSKLKMDTVPEMPTSSHLNETTSSPPYSIQPVKLSHSDIDQRIINKGGILRVPQSHVRASGKVKKKRVANPSSDQLLVMAKSTSKTSSPNISTTLSGQLGKRMKSKSMPSKSMSKRTRKVRFDKRITVHLVPADEERGSYEWRKNLTRQGIYEAMLWKSELENLGCYDN